MQMYFAPGPANKCIAPKTSFTNKLMVIGNLMQYTPAELAYFSSDDESGNYEADDENEEE
ncbi:hypothetical protein C0995_013914, partial [Termitomyces sp. Mi166